MDNTPIKQIFEELYFLLEGLEAKHIAILRFLRDEGVAPEEKLATYLEEASNASSVKWRAARVRMEHLFAPPPRQATDEVSKPEKAESQETKPQKSEPAPAQAANPAVSKTESKGSEGPSRDETKHDSEERKDSLPKEKQSHANKKNERTGNRVTSQPDRQEDN